MGKLPFDLAEAEQELQEGPLGIQRQRLWHPEVGHQPQTAGGAADVCRGLFPWGQMTSFSVGGLLLALVVAVVKLVVGVLIIALFENSMARLRFCATSRVTWAGFGFAFLAFVSLLVA
jgi:formate hydrogenlyase subunit 4